MAQACATTAATLPFAVLAAALLGAALGRWSLGGGGEALRCVDKGIVWHGRQQNLPYQGGPEGSCWCGDADGYCLCTPSLSVDIVLYVPRPPGGGPAGVVLVQRRHPPLGLAVVGGFVDVGETVEAAAVRETAEETGIRLAEADLRVLRVFSDPRRDPRRHTASVLMGACVRDARGMRAGDDATEVTVHPLAAVGELQLAFRDHQEMLRHFLQSSPDLAC